MSSSPRPLSDAERWGVRALRAVAALALASAALAVAVPAASMRPVLSYTAIGLVLVGPLVRVGIPARRWRRPPDRRFLALAGLVAVVLPLLAALVTSGG